MKQLWTSRRLFIATLAIIASVWRPEIAGNAMTIALAIAAANSVQKVMEGRVNGK